VIQSCVHVEDPWKKVAGAPQKQRQFSSDFWMVLETIQGTERLLQLRSRSQGVEKSFLRGHAISTRPGNVSGGARVEIPCKTFCLTKCRDMMGLSQLRNGIQLPANEPHHLSTVQYTSQPCEAERSFLRWTSLCVDKVIQGLF